MSNPTNPNAEPLSIGSRLEPLVDDYLFAHLDGGLEMRLHPPAKREVVMQTDAPWEGNACLYRTVMQDDQGLFRMYYGAWQYDMGGDQIAYPHPYYLCYAESPDGKRWNKPDLGLVEYAGSRHNNIVLSPDSLPPIDLSAGDTAIFRDPNPACEVGAEYKALVPSRSPRVLYALQSPDGYRFSLTRRAAESVPEPVITQGYFDSQNLAFWDGYRPRGTGPISVTSAAARRMACAELRRRPRPTFCTGASRIGSTTATARRRRSIPIRSGPTHAPPHIFFGFPMRYVDRGWVGADRQPARAGTAQRTQRRAHPLRHDGHRWCVHVQP